MAAAARRFPIDRGFVLIRPGPDGHTVIVCARVDEGRPVRPYAVHRRCDVLEVAADVKMIRGGGRSWSAGVVETFHDPTSNGLRIQSVTAIEDPSVLNLPGDQLPGPGRPPGAGRRRR
jgi:hypothetical protein